MNSFRGRAIVLLAGVLICQAAPGSAADIAAGKRKAMQCAVCHGPNGIAVNPEAPNLAGEAPIYIEKQLKAFRSGERKSEQMSIMAKDLTDQDIGDLAAWYAAIKVSAEPPVIK
jgi:cytochrome c553